MLMLFSLLIELLAGKGGIGEQSPEYDKYVQPDPGVHVN